MTSSLHRLEAIGDRLSPIVVKEVRQFVRSREFLASFATSLVVALVIAFFGSTQAIGGSRTAGSSTFTTLTACLGLLGMAVVPLGAFTTLRTERLEQTLDLISLTTMSPRRIVVGKLAAQAVKLVTFFAVMMPFIATSFLLGGIDFVTILTAMVTVFLASMWVAAAALFASTMFQSRLMSGLAFGVIGIIVFVLFTVGRALFLTFRYGYGVGFALGSPAGQWWQFGSLVAFCLMTMANLVLLAETHLALPTENRASTLRLGFLAQFLLIVAWALVWRFVRGYGVSTTSETLLVFGGLHLAVVAAFAVTEGLTPPDPRVASPRWLRRWPWLRHVFGPGGGRAAFYVVLQMIVFVLAGAALGAAASDIGQFVSLCGAICLLTGLPALVVHRGAARGLGPLHARGLLLIVLLLSLVLPDVLYYVLWRPEVFTISFGARHLASPVLPLFNWSEVQSNGWEMAPLLWAVAGLVTYLYIMAVSGADRVSVSEPVTLRVASGSETGAGGSR